MRWPSSVDPFKVSPGRCPVCDAPDTTCTSPDYQGTGPMIIVPPVQPVTTVTIGPAVTTDPTPAATTFTTKTYRGKKGRQPR